VDKFFHGFFAAEISPLTFEALLKGDCLEKKFFKQLLQSEKRPVTFALPK